MADTDTEQTPIAPPGHSIPAHRVHGWCAYCRGRTLAEEVIAWRSDAQERHVTETESAQYIETTTAWEACPECGHDDTLSTVTVMARAKSGWKPAGGWRYCINCQAVPKEDGRG
ncbi:hypothetical protein [Streptomyces cinereoruber]|uniref:hypothetical protein n=1 Tax=Streptomyces cinereoruber TaxID=67260 RepID=UPI00363E558E